MQNIDTHNINNIFRWVILLCFLFSISYGYLNVELLTFVNSKNIPTSTLCSEPETDFKFSKIIKYEKYKNTARIFCLYKDYRYNQFLVLNLRNETWTTVSKELANSRFNFYWPIYL